MIPGIEGLHTWNGPVPLTLNDREAWPRFEVETINGLKGAGQADDNRQDRSGRRGERTLFSTRRGKTISYEGRIRGRSLLELRQGEGMLAAAFDEINGEYRMDSVWHPTLKAAMAGGVETDRWFTARALDYQITDAQKAGWYERNFAVTLRLSDPRVFFPAAVTANLDASRPPLNGGSVLPSTLPATIAASTNTAINPAAVTNPGATDADPVFQINGPARSVTLLNVTTGDRLAVADVNLQAGTSMTIDFATRSVTVASGDVSRLIDWGRSSWWDRGRPGLPPGTSQLRAFDQDFAPLGVTVSFYPADPA